MSATAETVMGFGIAAFILGLLIVFPLGGLLLWRERFETADFCGWFGVRLAVIRGAVAVFSTCGDIRQG